ncbi:MAG: hypothetical protein U0441_33425 [Polyangiaceae bacterium]
MNSIARFGWMALSARLGAASALAGVLAIGCTSGDGGSGGTGGAGGTGGTGGSTEVTCQSAVPSQYYVSTAIHETGVAWKAPDYTDPPSTLTVSGTVADVGSGAIPEDCAYDKKGTAGAWLSVVDADGKSWTACYTATGAFMPVQSGDAVDLTFESVPAGLGGISYALTLRRAGALMLYVLEDGMKSFTLPEEISIADGDEVCVTEDEYNCTRNVHRAVVTSGGDSAPILPGESYMVGGYNIHVGRWEDVGGPACDAGIVLHEAFVVPAP